MEKQPYLSLRQRIIVKILLSVCKYLAVSRYGDREPIANDFKEIEELCTKLSVEIDASQIKEEN